MATVFIVDDEIDIHHAYKDFLEFHGHFVVDVACNGREAIESFKKMEKKPDIIIIDHRMPGIGGTEVAKQILNLEPNAKVIFASADESAKKEALSIGACSFKLKPFTIDKMINNINKAMGSNSLNII